MDLASGDWRGVRAHAAAVPPADECRPGEGGEGVMRINHVLCLLDFSEISDRALQRAAVLGRWCGATITALHVWPPVPMSVVAGHAPCSSRPTTPIESGRRPTIARVCSFRKGLLTGALLRQASAWAEPTGRSCVSRRRRAPPSSSLARPAQGRFRPHVVRIDDPRRGPQSRLSRPGPSCPRADRGTAANPAGAG